MMGVDLRLLPYDASFFSHTVLTLERRSELFDELMTLPAMPVETTFFSYLGVGEHGDRGYGETTTTPYGEQLTFVQARALKLFAEHPAVQDNYKNRAVWAYLAHLPDATNVALFWC